MMMFKRKILLVLTPAGKKHFLLILATILTLISINTLIFANIGGNPLKGRNIIIDPGHGGIDSGAKYGDVLYEKDVNLQLALKLQKILLSEKSNAALTRSSDISLDGKNNLSSSRHTRDLLERVIQFNSGLYDIFISLHVNYSSNTQAMGPVVLYSVNVPQTPLLAASLQESINNHIKNCLSINISRQPVISDFFILRNANIPGVIIEAGFISNPGDRDLLKDDTYQTKLAEAILDGIRNFFKHMPAKPAIKSKYIAPPREEEIPVEIEEDFKVVKK